jgi:uncharacterized protein (TIGR02246 family)
MKVSALATLSQEDVMAIHQTHEEWRHRMLSQDFHGLANLYTEDAILMPPQCAAIEGRKAIREWMAAYPRITQFTFDIRDIDGSDDLAYVRGAFTMRFHPPGATEPIEAVGKFIEISRKQPDGGWLLANDIFNTDK